MLNTRSTSRYRFCPNVAANFGCPCRPERAESQAPVFIVRKQRRQVGFIRETLAADRMFDNRRVIASLSTVPGRINNLRPTIRSLLKQTRPPDEIILAIPEFSIREERSYAVPKHVSRWARMRVLHCQKDWGPATKFIPIVREELAAGRENTLIIVVDDDRIYPRDALETYLHYNKQLPEAVLCFRGAAMPRDLDWRHAKMIRPSELRQPQPAAVITGVRKLFDSAKVLRRIVMGLLRGAAGGVFHGRYLGQWVPNSSQSAEICCPCVRHDAERAPAAPDVVTA